MSHYDDVVAGRVGACAHVEKHRQCPKCFKTRKGQGYCVAFNADTLLVTLKCIKCKHEWKTL